MGGVGGGWTASAKILRWACTRHVQGMAECQYLAWDQRDPGQRSWKLDERGSHGWIIWVFLCH